MREGLRSSSSKKLDCKSAVGQSDGDFRRVKIPDLNLDDDQHDVSPEEKGKLCFELSYTDKKSNGLVCEKEREGLGENEDKGVAVEDSGVVNGSLNVECSHNVSGEKNEEVGVEGKVGDVGWSKEVCSTGVIVEEETDDSSRKGDQDTSVGKEQLKAVVEGLNCSVDSNDQVLESPSDVDKDKDNEEGKGSMVSRSVEGDLKKGSDGSSKTERMEEHSEIIPDLSRDIQASPGAVIESPEKLGVNSGIKHKFNEGDRSENLKTESTPGKVQNVARILRSRVVPASSSGEETVKRNSRVSNRKRNRGADDLGVEAVIVKDKHNKSDVGTNYMSDCGKRKAFVEPQNAQAIPGDEVVSSKLLRSSGKKGKCGRPKITRDHPEVDVVQISKAGDDGLNDNSARSSKKKGGRGRPRKYECSFENKKVIADKILSEKAVADNIEDKPEVVSNMSVGMLTSSRDHPEEEKAPVDEVKACIVEDKDLNNKSVSSSKTKRGRGRPKKYVNGFAKKKDGRGRPRKYANCFENEKAVPVKTYNVPGDVGKESIGRRNNFRDHPEKDVAQMNILNAAKVEDEVLNNLSARSSKTKGGHGRPKKYAYYIKNEKDVDKIENTPESVKNKSVRSLTPTRKSGRQKRSVDYSEVGAVRKRRKFSYCRLDDDDDTMNEDEETGLTSKVVKKSKKKGKRGRPKKELGNREVEMQCDDKDKVNKDDMKMKVFLATAPVRRNRKDICPHIEPEKLRNGVSPLKGIRSSKKVKFAGLRKDTNEGSEGEENPLPEKKLPVKRKRVETAGSLSSEKNLIRQQIVDMLLCAGWTIEYRPRFGREYNDSVYVNREGKTHWSVTKAYYSLLQEVEESKVGDPNFTFTPLPEELLSKLFRVVSKTRSDKNKKKKDKDNGDTSDEEVTGDKRHKRKPSVRVGTQGRRRCALVVRRSNQGSNTEIDGAITHTGKHSVLAWMIDLGTISLNGTVYYKNWPETEYSFEGSITRDGVYCCCCKEIISVSEFEVHAGSKLCRSYENVYLENGSSLLQCLLDSWNKQEEAGCLGFHGVNVDDDDPNDDTCAICGDGGDLMCCDGCPSTFHLGCLRMEELPLGEWHCVYCSCKVCGVGGESETQGADCGTVSSQLVACCLCEEKYHKSCTREDDVMLAESRRPEFCGKNCEQIYEKLECLLGTKCELGDGFSCTLLQRSDLKADSVTLEAQKIQDNSKLAVALAVMEECFLPIIDPRSGVSLIRHVVYSCGSNFNRLNFSSFLTIVLEKGDEVISAASIRIRGKQLAEMPFVGTRNVYRRQGMCRRLLTGIEQALSSLEIENLVIPAIPELMDTWTSVFGFKPLEESVREEMRSMNMLVFAHTDMLQKPIVEKQLCAKSTSLIGEKDENSGASQNDNLDGGADKIGTDKLEIDNGTLNGKIDLNCVAPNNPDTLSDERRVVHPDSDAENCEDEVKSIMNSEDLKDTKNDGGSCSNSSEVRTLHPDLNLMAENDSLSDDHVMKSDVVAKSTSNSSGLTNVKRCCVVESDNDQNGDSTAVTSSEKRSLNPDLNLEGNVLENHDSLPSNSASICGATGSGDPLSRFDGRTPADQETQRDDNLLEVCQVEEIRCSDTETDKLNGDSTAVASSEKRSLNPDLNLEGNVLENHDSLPSNSASICGATGSGDPLSRLDGRTPADHETHFQIRIHDSLPSNSASICSATGSGDPLSRLDGRTPADKLLEVCRVEDIRCSDTEASKTHDVGPCNDSISTGAEVPPMSVECSESETLMCSRTAQLMSESSCNMRSVTGESCVAGVSPGSGITKFGPTET